MTSTRLITPNTVCRRLEHEQEVSTGSTHQCSPAMPTLLHPAHVRPHGPDNIYSTPWPNPYAQPCQGLHRPQHARYSRKQCGAAQFRMHPSLILQRPWFFSFTGSILTALCLGFIPACFAGSRAILGDQKGAIHTDFGCEEASAIRSFRMQPSHAAVARTHRGSMFTSLTSFSPPARAASPSAHNFTQCQTGSKAGLLAIRGRWSGVCSLVCACGKTCLFFRFSPREDALLHSWNSWALGPQRVPSTILRSPFAGCRERDCLTHRSAPTSKSKSVGECAPY